MSVRAILWDLDGVIVNSGEYHFEAYRRLMAEHGRDLPRERFFEELFGRRNYDILQSLLAGITREEAERLAERKERLFRELVAGNISALPGARELLRRAHRAGLHQAIVSSTPAANIDLILRTLRVEDCFQAIVGEEDAREGKPHPQGFLVAARRLRVRPAACAVIEDAPAGVEAARAAGMRCIAVTTTRPPQMLANSDLVVDSLDDERVWQFLTSESG